MIFCYTTRMKSEKKSSKSSGVLYRKYRPQKFSDIIGQNHIVRVLEGAIKLGNISHAYLFSGPRGTGKTSWIKTHLSQA